MSGPKMCAPRHSGAGLCAASAYRPRQRRATRSGLNRAPCRPIGAGHWHSLGARWAAQRAHTADNAPAASTQCARARLSVSLISMHTVARGGHRQRRVRERTGIDRASARYRHSAGAVAGARSARAPTKQFRGIGAQPAGDCARERANSARGTLRCNAAAAAEV